MEPVAAWVVLVGSVMLLLATTFVLRPRLPIPAADALFAVAGMGVGIGGLLFFDEPGLGSWIVTPVLLAVCAVAHARALFAGDGPFRT